MEKKTEFKPYIPADRVTPELTVTSIIMGIILAVVLWFGLKKLKWHPVAFIAIAAVVGIVLKF